MYLNNFLTVVFVTASASMASAVAETPSNMDFWQSAASNAQEAYIEEKLPPSIQVVATALDGPVYADAQGRTLYTWPLIALRNGSTGDRKDGGSNCTDEVLRTEVGFMSPYPAGLVLPYADQGVSCTQVWPPVIASEDAVEVGKWSLAERADGSKQWAYDGFPLYTSNLDKKAGDVLGGTKISSGGDGGVVRVPAGPLPDIPPGFQVLSSTTGRVLLNDEDYSIYYSDNDEANTSNCVGECLDRWTPISAPQVADDSGDWSIIKHPSGINQWAYRGKPLYTHNNDTRPRSFDGSDVPGWHNVYTQRTVTPPDAFTVQDSALGGQVLADSRGRTIYYYSCHDDSVAQLACDHPDAVQDYRMAICGNGNAQMCLETFPYVVADANAKSESSLWSVMTINPNTGRHAESGEEGALNVWAYRQRPVYTYGGDHEPGVTNGDSFGEFLGRRNGYKAFVLRDVFQNSQFRR
ncbi:MAG: COG4315 family predicted lipoprotein [Gammaproteobacteria bacterium]